MKGLQAPRTTAGFAAALAVAGLVTECAPKAPTIADRILGSDLRLMPKESVGLAVVEMKSLRDRDAAERWLDELAAGLDNAPSLEMIRQAVGPEVVHQVDSVALALVAQPGGSTGYAVLAEGEFDEPRMRELTGGQGIVTLLEVTGRPDVSLTVLPGGNPVFGPRGVLVRLLETQAGRSGGLHESSLLGILGKVRPTAQIWGAIDYAPLADLARRALRAGGGDAPLALPQAGSGNLRALAFQGVIDKAVAFDLFGQADAEPGARQLADAARGLVALARLSASQQEARQWLEFLDGIRIDQSGAEIHVQGTLTSAMAHALAGHLPGSAEGVALPDSAAPPGGLALPPPGVRPPMEEAQPSGTGGRPPA